MAEKKGGKAGKSSDAPVIDERQLRRERIHLVLWLLLLPTAILGMISLSTFLSSGVEDVNRPIFWAFLACMAVMAAGMGYQYATKPRAAK